MKTTVLTCICAFFIALSGLQAQSFVPNEVIIKFTGSSSQVDRANFIASIGATLLGDTDNTAAIGEEVLLGVSFPITINGQTVYTEVDLINNIAGGNNSTADIDTGSLNYHLSVSPMSFGQFVSGSGMSDYSPISASCEASYPGGALEPSQPLNISSDTKVKVAILDTGLDPSFPTINQYVTEEANVLLDDDGIGLIEKKEYIPSYEKSIVVDQNGHGTAITGIIAGLADRANISPDNLEILVIKCFGDDGSGTLYNMLQAASIAKFYDVINISWSYTRNSLDPNDQILENTVNALSNQKSIVVCGAGNDASNLNNLDLGPANYQGVLNLLTVGGYNACDETPSSFTNYGGATNIFAPSESLSIPWLGGYWKLNASGTSFGTAIVTAATAQAALTYYTTTNSTQDDLASWEINPIYEMLLDKAIPVQQLGKRGKVVSFNFNDTEALTIQNSDNRETRTQQLTSDKKTTAVLTQSYPNPFHSSLNIQLDAKAEGQAQLELINMQGQVVMQQSVNVVEGNIALQNLAHLSKGSYILNIQQNDQTYKQLVVKN